MIPPDLDAAMRGAFAAHQAGRLDEAEGVYRAVLTRLPGFPDAHHLLGLVRYQRKDYPAAADEIRRAIAGNPQVAMFWFNLGNVLRDAGKRPEAIDAFRRAVELQPALPGAAVNLANLLRESGRFREALPLYEDSLARFPQNDIALNGIGCCYRSLGRADDAEKCLRRAVELNPRSTVARINLAKLLCAGKGQSEALAIVQPLLASGLCTGEQVREIGNVFARLRRSVDAEAAFREALRIDPADHRARAELAGVLLGSWQHDLAEAEYVRFFQAGFDAPECLQGALMSALYFDRWAPQELCELHRRYDRALARQSAGAPAPARKDVPQGRRIRIGFVSPDFRMHSCAHFIRPLLAHVDRSRFETFAYANVARPDGVTATLRTAFEHWRDIVGASPDEVRGQVAQDGIDLLFDLAGHSGDNALPAFSPRAAPVQAAWLGYPATTGLSSIDFRLTDAVADPPEEGGAHCVEGLVRLPDGFLCYQTLADLDAPAPAPGGGAAEPAAPPEGTTFGSFNNLAKVTPAVLALWADIVRSVPEGRLVLKAIQFGDPVVRERVLAFLAARGLEADRVVLNGWKSASGDHLGGYRAIDVALDPFPYNGATTTCEALSMGVPVVVLRGRAHVGRVGASLLSAIGHPELIAETTADYRAIAIRLATETAWRNALRAGLAERFRASPLNDAERFARKFERAVETMLGPVARPG